MLHTHSASSAFTLATYECPNSAVSGCCGCRTSQILMVLSMEPVAMMQSLYLHQSADSTSKACAGSTSVGCGCRRSHSRTVVSPDADRNTSPCAGALAQQKKDGQAHELTGAAGWKQHLKTLLQHELQACCNRNFCSTLALAMYIARNLLACLFVPPPAAQHSSAARWCAW